MPGRPKLFPRLFGLSAFTLIAACRPGPLRPPLRGDILQLPPDSARSQIAAYVNTLRFVSAPPAADRRIGPGGDTLFIEPEQSANRLSMTELAGGRIIARMKSRTPYPAAGLGPSWWTYWWVDGRGAGGTYRSVFVAISGTELIRQSRHLSFAHHDISADYPDVSARISLRGDSIWGRCGSCCRALLLPSDTLSPY
jgi:hypothetical protein